MRAASITVKKLQIIKSKFKSGQRSKGEARNPLNVFNDNQTSSHLSSVN